MTKEEALAAFAAHGPNIEVRHRSGRLYLLNRDIVDASDTNRPYVYGDALDKYPKKPSPRNRNRNRNRVQWFFLENVELATGEQHEI